MKRLTKILSIALLLLFVTTLLHDVVPHVHHEHGFISSSAVHQNHQHDNQEEHQHHHSNENESEQENSELSIFDLLFATHSHIKHVHQDVPKIVEHSKKVKHIDGKEFYKTTIGRLDYPPLQKELHSLFLFNLPIPDNPYLQSNQLRGPPSLG